MASVMTFAAPGPWITKLSGVVRRDVTSTAAADPDIPTHGSGETKSILQDIPHTTPFSMDPRHNVSILGKLVTPYQPQYDAAG